MSNEKVAVTVIVSLVDPDGDPADDEDIALVTEYGDIEDIDEIAEACAASACDEARLNLGVADEM